jgi:hypothetical protein
MQNNKIRRIKKTFEAIVKELEFFEEPKYTEQELADIEHSEMIARTIN